MKKGLRGIFFYTIVTSGFAYLFTYIIATSKYTNKGAAISLVIGLCVYLLIRMIYKKDEGFDKLSAKAYRLIIWLVPLLLIATYLIFFYINPGDEPRFIEYYSFGDLWWCGPFVIVVWPFVNVVTFLENFLILLQMLIYYLGTPVLIGLLISVIIMLVTVFKKFISLKEKSVVQFSLILATIYVLTPIIGFTFCIYLWF